MPQKTMAEYVAVQRTVIERPEANLRIAAVQVEQNRLEEAEPFKTHA